MNSDPYDSAAWRTFGMLDADESAIFDEAMRHDPVLRSAYLEMDRLSAAIGAASVAPVEPRAGQLERLQNRLGLYPVRRVHFWAGVSGWAAAAVLALLMVFTRGENQKGRDSSVAGGLQADPAARAVPQHPPGAVPASVAKAVTQAPEDGSAEEAIVTSEALVAAEELAKANVKVETKRLIQEIEVLRDNLEKFQQRDRVLFEAVPGVAVPVVMTMRPPSLESDGEITIVQNDPNASITGMLGDALKLTQTGRHQSTAATLPEANAVSGDESLAGSALQVAPQPDFLATVVPAAPATQVTTTPSAIPIYDAARDSGTLVVNNLPATGEGRVYNLWVNTQDGGAPIYVGSLPVSANVGPDSFDFSLGSTNVLPSGFVLTQDQVGKPSTPSVNNTVLLGPTTTGQ